MFLEIYAKFINLALLILPRLLYQIIISITLYIVVLYYVSYKFMGMLINGVYTLIKHPIIGLEQCKVLNLTMTLCICTIGNLISFLNMQHLKGIF